MKKVTQDSKSIIKTYSQNKEDIIIDSILGSKESGFYIDVGAGHPDYLSVTKLFYLKGWQGISIEPNPRLASLHREERPRDIVIQAAVAPDEQALTLREYIGDGLSTVNRKVQENNSNYPNAFTEIYQDHQVHSTRLDEVFAKHCAGLVVDFIKIDVEGFEESVLMSNNWTMFRPRLICIETSQGSGWEKILVEQRYALIYNDGINAYYLDNTFYKTLPDIPHGKIFNPLIVSKQVAEMLSSREVEIENYKNLLVRLDHDRRDHAEMPRFRHIAKMIIKKTDLYIQAKLTSKNSGMETVDRLSSVDWDSRSTNFIQSAVTIQPTQIRVYSTAKHKIKYMVKKIRGKR